MLRRAHRERAVVPNAATVLGFVVQEGGIRGCQGTGISDPTASDGSALGVAREERAMEWESAGVDHPAPPIPGRRAIANQGSTAVVDASAFSGAIASERGRIDARRSYIENRSSLVCRAVPAKKTIRDAQCARIHRAAAPFCRVAGNVWGALRRPVRKLHPVQYLHPLRPEADGRVSARGPASQIPFPIPWIPR